MNIQKSLENFGFKDKEAAAYIALLKLAEANAHQIAKEAELERTTIYQILEALCEKGLAHKIIKGKRYFYVAEPLGTLEQFVKSKISNLDNLLPLLAGIARSSSEKPVVKYYETLADIKREFADRADSKEKLVRDFAFVKNVVEVFGKRFIDNQIERRLVNKVRVLSLRRGPKEKDLQDDWYIKADTSKDLMREVRYLDPKFTFDQPLITIYDHTVGVFSSEKQLSALIIESPEFSKAMKVLFDIAWVSAKIE